MILPALLATPLVIGHRGASAYRPEHTLASYELAIEQGADFVEPDLVPTKDGVLVARHENEISGTTDVAAHPEFADRRTTKTIDGLKVTGWFTEDFSLAELKTLRAKERLPKLRTANAALDGRYEIPTFEEILTMLDRHNKASKKAVGVYPEAKHPTYFRQVNLPLEGRIVDLLKKHGYEAHPDRVFLQCFEPAGCREFWMLTKLPIVQLLDTNEEGRRLTTPEGLKEVRTYADAVGLTKDLVIPRPGGKLGEPSNVVRDAHAAGSKVHVWTFRPEDVFLPTDLKGKPEEEIQRFVAAGIDGLFTDAPDVARRALGG